MAEYAVGTLPPTDGTWLVRAADRATGTIRVGAVDPAGLHHVPDVDDIGSLLELDLANIRTIVESGLERPPLELDDHLLLPPIDGDTEAQDAGAGEVA